MYDKSNGMDGDSMDFFVKEGDYAVMGAACSKQRVIFTFCGEKEQDCAILLCNIRTKEQYRIEAQKDYCLGSLRSVEIALKNPKEYGYLYEIDGKMVLDPYARALIGREIWGDRERRMDSHRVYGAICQEHFDWGEDRAPEIPKESMVMYKLHVRGFSMDKGAPKRIAGTFEAITSKLSYLQKLGVTTVELMPAYEFEELVIPKKLQLPSYVNLSKGETAEQKETVEPEEEIRINYWGYKKGNYFAVKSSYAKDPAKASASFMQLVKALHANGMECVMEMYFPEETNPNLILDALRFWVKVYHVDGFHLMGASLPIRAITQDVLLSRTKIFVPNLDGATVPVSRKYPNLYLYKEEYQYPVRKILNHINGDMVEFTNQQKKQGTTTGYVNFVSSNNGFTLADVFMYNDRHNEDNGEHNMDGDPWNFSSNYGYEGPSRKPFVNRLRHRQWRNAMLCMFLAQGVPMIWSGDEIQNSQQGNNNAYCQDNPIGWVNWKQRNAHEEDIRFVEAIAKFRREHPILSQGKPYQFSDYRSMGFPDVSYHGENAWLLGVDVGRMNLGVMYCGAYDASEGAEDIYVGYNFYSSTSTLALPKLGGRKKWYPVIDTANEKEPVAVGAEALPDQAVLSLKPQSICVLVGRS